VGSFSTSVPISFEVPENVTLQQLAGLTHRGFSEGLPHTVCLPRGWFMSTMGAASEELFELIPHVNWMVNLREGRERWLHPQVQPHFVPRSDSKGDNRFCLRMSATRKGEDNVRFRLEGQDEQLAGWSSSLLVSLLQKLQEAPNRADAHVVQELNALLAANLVFEDQSHIS